MNGFTNNGLIEFITSYPTTIGTLRLTNGTLVNASGGTIKNSTGASRIDAAFDNQGSILLDRSMEINKDDAAHTNSGTITINKASEKLTLKGLSFSNQPTGILNGRGTIDISSIDFINSGVINPGTSSGKLNIKGNLPQDNQSIINIEIGGIVADDSYDQLNVSGQFLLDGKLNISLIDNYIPAAGETFDIMTFASQTGDFNSINGLFTGTGVSFDVVSNPTSLQLVTVSAPNHSPVILNQIPDINLDEDFGSHLFADLDSIFDDSDIPLGDSLIYEFSISNGLLNGSIVDSELRLQSVSDSNGVISVVVTATDIGLLSISDTFLITISAVNDPPSIFSIISPQGGTILESSDTVNFTWDASSDKDEDQLVYTLKIYNASADTTIEGINETTFEFISNGFLQSNTTYNWTIIVTDGTETVPSPDTFSFTTPVASYIEEYFDWIPGNYSLSQNFPNPFRYSTTILFNLPVTERMTLKVYDHLGREVLILIDEEKPAGAYKIEFDASELKGGIYFYKIQAGDYVDSKKMILLK